MELTDLLEYQFMGMGVSHDRTSFSFHTPKFVDAEENPINVIEVVGRRVLEKGYKQVNTSGSPPHRAVYEPKRTNRNNGYPEIIIENAGNYEFSLTFIERRPGKAPNAQTLDTLLPLLIQDFPRKTT